MSRLQQFTIGTLVRTLIDQVKKKPAEEQTRIWKMPVYLMRDEEGNGVGELAQIEITPKGVVLYPMNERDPEEVLNFPNDADVISITIRAEEKAVAAPTKDKLTPKKGGARGKKK